MLKKQIEAWVIRDIGLTEFDNWDPVLKFATRLSIRTSAVASLMVAGILVVLHALDVLLNPLARDMAIGCGIAWVVSFTLTMLCSLYMGYAVIHLARTRLEFRQMSRTDMLSGLLNRRAFIDDLSQTIAVTVSGGIADITPLRDFSAVYAAADRALYVAKSSGRNRIVLERDLPRAPHTESQDIEIPNAAFSAA
eukprot:gene29167-32941_t